MKQMLSLSFPYLIQAGFFIFAAMSIIVGILCRLLGKGSDDCRTFKEDILILQTGSKKPLPAVALLDTQCQKGNWISSRLVEKLGLSDQVRTDFEPPEVFDANGEPVKACGAVDLVWRCPDGTRNNSCRFYVLPRSGDEFDVILGAEFIRAKGLLTMNRSHILPLLEHKKVKKKEKDAIDAAKEAQAQQKADLEARRNKHHGQQDSGGEKKGSHTT